LFVAAVKDFPASPDRSECVFDCRMANDAGMMSSTNPERIRTAERIYRVVGNTFKAIAFLILIACGLLFGSDALDNGKLPLVAIAGLAVAALLFWIGDKLNPTF
jgi:hypothetical protein